MLITIAAAAAANGAAAHGAEYGLIPALKQGGPLTIFTFAIMVIMSIGSFYILFSKLIEQQKIMNQAKKVRASFWNNTSLKEAAGKLDKDSAYRQLVDDGLRAQDQHNLLTDPTDQHDWTLNALARTRAAIGSKLNRGLSFLASTGSTAPFIGLFGTVVGILSALVKIGAAGQASIDTVAGPVGEALIMTAIGLAVAVPAVLGYNYLIRRNKTIQDALNNFAADLNGFLMSGSRMAVAAPAAAPASASTITPSAAVKGGSAKA